MNFSRNKPYKPLICVDFDGVINSYTSGWQGPRKIPDDPVPGAIEWLYDAYCFDTTGKIPLSVAIYSTRSQYWFGRQAMKVWLTKHVHKIYKEMPGPFYSDPVYIDLPDWIQWPKYKPPALITIDDRAVQFTDDWAEFVISTLVKFKPWNKK